MSDMLRHSSFTYQKVRFTPHFLYLTHIHPAKCILYIKEKCCKRMIWNPFSKKQDYRLGIDIGTSSVKVVELWHEGGKAKLKNYAEFYVSEGENFLQSSSLKILDAQVVQILKNMFSSAQIVSNQASISIPAFSSFSTLINLPAMPQEELNKTVRFEARKYIPIPITEVQFDWVKVPFLSNEKMFKILAVSVPNEIIEKYHRILKALGINLVHTELETFSAARSLLQGDTAPIVILDIGSRSTNVNIIEQGLVVMHHNIGRSGFNFTKVLSQGLSIDFQRAEEMKRTTGLSNSVSGGGQSAELLYPLVDKIILEIKKMTDDYTQQGGGMPVKIVMHGGSSLMPGLAQYIQNSTKIKTEIGNAFSSVQVPEELSGILSKESPEFAVAVGLALR